MKVVYYYTQMTFRSTLFDVPDEGCLLLAQITFRSTLFDVTIF